MFVWVGGTPAKPEEAGSSVTSSSGSFFHEWGIWIIWLMVCFLLVGIIRHEAAQQKKWEAEHGSSRAHAQPPPAK